MDDGGDRDIINVAAGTYTEEGITVDHEVSILGSGAENCIVQAHANPNTATDRVFTISSGNDVTIKNITIQNGNTTVNGGGISFSSGILVLENIAFLNNKAGGAGGAIMLNSFSTNNISNCTFEGNSANAQGGVIYLKGTTTITNSTITGNSGGTSALYCIDASHVTLTNCTVTNNTDNSNSNGAVFTNGTYLTVQKYNYCR